MDRLVKLSPDNVGWQRDFASFVNGSSADGIGDRLEIFLPSSFEQVACWRVHRHFADTQKFCRFRAEADGYVTLSKPNLSLHTQRSCRTEPVGLSIAPLC